MRAFFDASALAKRYVDEPGSAEVDTLFEQLSPPQIVCSVIGVAEVMSIFVRKLNGGRIDPVYFRHAVHALRTEFIEAPDRLIPIDSTCVLDSLRLIHQHSLNATDALILHSLLTSSPRSDTDPVVLVTSDRRLLRAAKREGVEGFDPERDGVAEWSRLLGSHRRDA